MATVLPPPSKRQKTAIAEKAQKQQDVEIVPSGLGSIRVQFSSQANGQPVGAPVSVPVADATVKNLELLLNTIQGNVCTLSFLFSMFKPSPFDLIESLPFDDSMLIITISKFAR